MSYKTPCNDRCRMVLQACPVVAPKGERGTYFRIQVREDFLALRTSPPVRPLAPGPDMMIFEIDIA